MKKATLNKTNMKRKIISLKTKIEILDRLKNKERIIDVAKFYSMNESTIRTIKQNEDSIRKSVTVVMRTSMSTTSYVRNDTMETMEKALIMWVEDQNQKRIPIDTNAIQSKALSIFNTLENQEQSSSAEKMSFYASRGWFQRFKQRHSLHNLKFKGEQASADFNEAQKYPQKFAEIISTKQYSPDQIFNADESGLFWKKMPQRTFLAKHNKTASGHKAAKDRVTILFCSNASGDHIMKPLVIGKANRPRAFKGLNINNLPVYWKANKRAWVTSTVFDDWFHNIFVPDVKKYLIKKGLPFKALLVLDNAPGHTQDLQHENVEVVFLPPNTTSLLQPLDQGIISTFKALYIKKSFRYILDHVENDGTLSIIDAWKKFTMLDCIKHISMSYMDIKKPTLHACWKSLWPDVLNGMRYSTDLDEEFSQIIELGQQLGGEGFEDLSQADINELMQDEDLNAEDLIEMVKNCGENSAKVDVESDIESNEPNVFTAKFVHEGLVLGRKLGNHFQGGDVILDRGLTFQRNINELLKQYEEVYKDMTNRNKQQKLISEYFPKNETIQTETNSTIAQPNEMTLSSDEAEIIEIRKKRLVVENDSD